MTEILFPLEGGRPRAPLSAQFFAASAFACPWPPGRSQQLHLCPDAMTTELNRAFTSLGKQESGKQLPPYFLSYFGERRSAVAIPPAQAGALIDSSAIMRASPDVQYAPSAIPSWTTAHGAHPRLGSDQHAAAAERRREALARSLWLATNAGYGKRWTTTCA